MLYFQFVILNVDCSILNSVFFILGGFYRHIYEQKLGPKLLSTDTASALSKKEASCELKSDAGDTCLPPHPIKKERIYRKRKIHEHDNSDDEANKQPKHLQYNLDADSDFSIDSDSENDEQNQVADVPSLNVKQVESNSVKNEEHDSKVSNKFNDGAELAILPTLHAENMLPLSPKLKSDVWQKCTVGSIFEDAVKRYFQRKALRSTNY